MRENLDVFQKMKKISELMGERVIFRIGINPKEGLIQILSVDIYHSQKTKTKTLTEIPNYIG